VGEHGRLILEVDAALAARLRELSGRRLVFFAGLPGTGKSLLVHQLAHRCRAAGRRVHLLQWDVARPAFEASRAGRRYPLAAGVTHAMIRRAAGLWARDALVRWSERAPAGDVLIGETPFVGGRFIELARRLDDRAESLLSSASARFAIAVPSREVRRFLEGERARRAARPRHLREREDAPPHVLRDLWAELAGVARDLGLAAPEGAGEEPPSYDPEVYRGVYERVLRHRHAEAMPLDTILPTGSLSVYDFAFAPLDLVPEAAEADAFIREAERRHPDPAALARDVARWWAV
jgi:hypothetical protein